MKNLLKQGLRELAEKWERDQVGFKMSNKGFLDKEGEIETYHLVNLEIFADNVILVASSYEEMQRMTNEITEVIHRFKLKWKQGRANEK